MNCLQKDWAIRDEEVRVRLVKVMGWLGGWRGDLPERDLRSDQNLEGSFWPGLCQSRTVGSGWLMSGREG